MENHIPQDPDHERFRKCPECGREFMTNHLSRIYCSNVCHDRYNSRKRRLARKENPPATPVFYNDRETKRQWNLQVLDRLQVPVAGLTVDANALEGEGYDIHTYDRLIPLNHKPESFAAVLGNYTINYQNNFSLNIQFNPTQNLQR